MKFPFFLAMGGLLLVILLVSGCTGSPPQVPQQTAVPSVSPTTAPPSAPVAVQTPAAVPYPDARALGAYADFGTGDRQGKATVYKYMIRSNYSWTAPSFNSPREQAAASLPNEIERGYNVETPQPGDAFLFIYVRVSNTGTAAVYAPSPSQFVVYANGAIYNYTSVHSSDVVIDGVSGSQYDYQIGKGGVVGYVEPGESNAADGYLIYEVPAGISADATYVLANLDYQHSAVWRL